MKEDRLYLIHILECISRIEKYVAGGREEFLQSTLIQDAVLRNLQTLGQSAQRLSETVRNSYTEIDWRGIIGLRNVLVHDYLGIALNRVWEIVEQDLPVLKVQIDAVLAALQ
jgi:uncharacterized protein with HEPN domain